MIINCLSLINFGLIIFVFVFQYFRISCRIPVISSSTVSYTHLDVYKRQIFHYLVSVLQYFCTFGYGTLFYLAVFRHYWSVQLPIVCHLSSKSGCICSGQLWLSTGAAYRNQLASGMAIHWLLKMSLLRFVRCLSVRVVLVFGQFCFVVRSLLQGQCCWWVA